MKLTLGTTIFSNGFILISIPQLMEALGLVLDDGKRLLTKDGVKIELTGKEFALLEYSMRNKDRVFSLDDPLNHVWVAEGKAAPDTVRVQ